MSTTLGGVGQVSGAGMGGWGSNRKRNLKRFCGTRTRIRNSTCRNLARRIDERVWDTRISKRRKPLCKWHTWVMP
jgi:hypothetical protein